jgi:hypothetical protein
MIRRRRDTNQSQGGVPTTGYYGWWLGLDPTNAPLLLRDT